MKFVSTRGGDQVEGLGPVAEYGLAHDGGLFVPASWPKLSEEQWSAFAGQPYEKAVAGVFGLFSGQEFANLEQLIARTYQNFDHPERAPLHQIGDKEWVLELFHGPTFAFKDFAMCWLAVLIEHLLQ
ncbi:hypothetical protein CAPTEDRAFT_69788, partial [Capitella teleta]